MCKNYDFNEIEKKWREIWKETPINPEGTNKPKYYCLDMFPYPSANGLHVGHWRGYVLSDVLSRYKILQGYEVLHPMGWDAFGLPAENFAIKNKIHPSNAVNQSIKNVKRQLQEISAVYNWDREINTTSPSYYKWTQWIFLQMFKNGLAYEKEMPLNWCPNCKAVLANEESTNGVCDRCKSEVTKKNLRQWMLKITNYAERLLNDLDKLNWPEKVKKMQADWIGKSYGAEIDFKVEDKILKVFTTRPDTIYGVSFITLSPEHKLIDEITTKENKQKVKDYVYKASTKSSVDRVSNKQKTGVFTGSYATNPINNSKVPIWISDYVLPDYGTGAIMCVPAHDERDFLFAKEFDLPIIQVISENGTNSTKLEKPFKEKGILINSDLFNGIHSEEAKKLICNFIEEKEFGKKTINYKLRDWVFSRQRYWGEPIPLIHCDDCGVVAVKEEDLPIVLPNVESYEPTSTGESPLASIKEWVNTTCPECGKLAKRETNTMPQWAGSSWYFLRYCDVNNDESLASKEILKKWMPVDMYVGGVEHAVLHLLYARFYTKFLYDIGVLDFEEPFIGLFNQGMITKDGAKMSKSMGNVVSPDELVSKYGCDSLRLYELFVGPPDIDCEWDDSGIDGTYRYLVKFWKFVNEYKNKFTSPSKEMEKLCHKMIYEITNRIETLSLNTVVSGFMEFTNKIISEAKKSNGIDKNTIDTLTILLAPFAPHICEEIWQNVLLNKGSIFNQKWPLYDENKMKETSIEIALQINGKLKETLNIDLDMDKDEIITLAKEKLKNKIEGNIIKEIYVPLKIVNLVVK